MKSFFLVVLIATLYGCSGNKFPGLLSDINRQEMILFNYQVGDEVFKCDPVEGQRVLKEWSKNLEAGEMASYADADHYLILEFRNGHNYKIRIFPGMAVINYSALYIDGVYIGEPLVLYGVCADLEAHNKSPQADGFAAAGLRR